MQGNWKEFQNIAPCLSDPKIHSLSCTGNNLIYIEIRIQCVPLLMSLCTFFPKSPLKNNLVWHACALWSLTTQIYQLAALCNETWNVNLIASLSVVICKMYIAFLPSPCVYRKCTARRTCYVSGLYIDYGRAVENMRHFPRSDFCASTSLLLVSSTLSVASVTSWFRRDPRAFPLLDACIFHIAL